LGVKVKVFKKDKDAFFGFFAMALLLSMPWLNLVVAHFISLQGGKKSIFHPFVKGQF
jgi:hypothetical protein